MDAKRTYRGHELIDLTIAVGDGLYRARVAVARESTAGTRNHRVLNFETFPHMEAARLRAVDGAVSWIDEELDTPNLSVPRASVDALRETRTTAPAMRYDASYETTLPLAPSWTAGVNYVKDTNEWIGRCLRRVEALDPVIPFRDAEMTVRELAALARWRVLEPEDAAEQLYAPAAPTIRRPR